MYTATHIAIERGGAGGERDIALNIGRYLGAQGGDIEVVLNPVATMLHGESRREAGRVCQQWNGDHAQEQDDSKRE